MINSIYFDLLNLGKDDYDGIDDCPNEIERDDNLIYMPLQRSTLKRGKGEINVADIKYAKVEAACVCQNGYTDGVLHARYPIAVSFTVKKCQYGEYRNTIALNEGIIRLDCHDARCNYSFVDGKEIAAISEGGRVKLVYGFAEES